MQLIIGIIVTAIIELLKRLRNVPINSGDTTKIRIVAGALSIIASIGLHAASGDLNDQFLATTADALTVFLASNLGYLSFLRK